MDKESIFPPDLGHKVEITLDGCPVELPCELQSLESIRSHLELLALESQRVLCSVRVDGWSAESIAYTTASGGFRSVQARTTSLEDKSLLILSTARQQLAKALEHARTAISLALINDGHVVPDMWRPLALELKQPVITLSLLPDEICGPSNGRASFTQLRKWQLQQVADIIRAVNTACQSGDPILFAEELEELVVPWLLEQLDMVSLWCDTALVGLKGRSPVR